MASNKARFRVNKGFAPPPENTAKMKHNQRVYPTQNLDPKK